MAAKNFSVEFYQINLVGDKIQPFENYLEHLLEDYKPDYTKPFFGEIHKSAGFNHWHGTINLVKKDYLPQIFNTDKAIARNMALEDSEGLLSVCAFMYVPKNKLLLVLKDFGAPGFSLLLERVKTKNELEKCEADILLKKEMYDKLSKAKEIKSFAFKAARIAPDALSKEDSAIDFIQSLQGISYGEISVTLKSRKGNELTYSWVKRLVDVFKRQPQETVKDLKVTVGGDNERKGEILNMLDYAFVTKVTMTTLDKTVQLDERERALEKAYQDAQDDLTELGL
ncbi:MAG: hypothetical protein IKP00_10165 [Victivallales bacterium]|nr:hypothetical protein [Victivallales bacterium]